MAQKKSVDYLVEYAKEQVGRPYWGGTYGKKATESLLKSKRAAYPSLYPIPGNPPFTSQFGQKVHDCNGLVNAARVCPTPDSEPVGGYPNPYYSVAGLAKACIDMGKTTKDAQLSFGELVFRGNRGHVGVYADGYVYHAKGHRWGVVKEKYSYNQWQEHGKFTECFEYHDEPTPTPTPTPRPEDTKMTLIRKGSKGKPVTLWQQILQINGMSLGKYGIDGDFGADTEKATKELQKRFFPNQKAEWDGIVGDKTWTKGFESCN